METLRKQLQHKCGIHFSSGPVDVGITAAHNGKQAYICEKCVEKKAAMKAQEDAEQASRFTRKWVK